jgi:hypothetical protein
VGCHEFLNFDVYCPGEGTAAIALWEYKAE